MGATLYPTRLRCRLISAAEALERLQEGNRRFRSNTAERTQRTSQERRAELTKQQQPFAIVLGCSDSRVPAEIVFDQGLGDLFVIRVAGNIVAPSQVGSVEFAASRFGTRGGRRAGAFPVRSRSGDHRGAPAASDPPVAESALDRRPGSARGRAAAPDRAQARCRRAPAPRGPGQHQRLGQSPPTRRGEPGTADPGRRAPGRRRRVLARTGTVEIFDGVEPA
jgi:hypothetical protein